MFLIILDKDNMCMCNYMNGLGIQAEKQHAKLCKSINTRRRAKPLAGLSNCIDTDFPYWLKLVWSLPVLRELFKNSRFKFTLRGRPGRVRVPRTVHLASTSSPNKASLASLTASVPTFDSPRSFGYLCSTHDTESRPSLSISDDGRQFSAPFLVRRG